MLVYVHVPASLRLLQAANTYSEYVCSVSALNVLAEPVVPGGQSTAKVTQWSVTEVAQPTMTLIVACWVPAPQCLFMPRFVQFQLSVGRR